MDQVSPDRLTFQKAGERARRLLFESLLHDQVQPFRAHETIADQA